MVVNVVAAFLIDLILGDPPSKFHPINLIGSMLSIYERAFYRLRWKILGGFLLVVLSCFSVFAIISGILLLAPFFELPFSANILLIFLIYFIFCNRSMVREAQAVRELLLEGNIVEARRQVSHIVGRDTEALDPAGVIRAAVESVAENIVDGFTAPLFYLMLGGVPAAYLYKTVNTIDSRFGYRTSQYERFGKPGARLDDALNFVPARLNVFFLLCAVGFNRMVLRTIVKYGQKHPSPNSGLAEAGFAGYLGIALGGPSYYRGILEEKPWIGQNRVESSKLEDPGIIDMAIALYWRVVWITLCSALAAAYFFNLPLVFG
jgi:adenosylcobinamide-phosphate synthase